MKSLIIPLIAAAMVAAAPIQGNARTEVLRKGDTTLVIAAHDTVRLVDGKAVAAHVKRLLDDTVYDGTAASIADYDTDQGGQALSPQQRAEVERIVAASGSGRDSNWWALMPVMVVTSVALCVTLVVLVIAIFSFKQRRLKYQLMEKAIEHDYHPLPFGQVIAEPQQHDSQQPEQPLGNQWAKGARPGGTRIHNFGSYRPCLPYLIAGVVGFLFFLSVDALPVALLFLAPLFFGLAKGFFIYQDMRGSVPPPPPATRRDDGDQDKTEA